MLQFRFRSRDNTDSQINFSLETIKGVAAESSLLYQDRLTKIEYIVDKLKQF